MQCKAQSGARRKVNEMAKNWLDGLSDEQIDAAAALSGEMGVGLPVNMNGSDPSPFDGMSDEEFDRVNAMDAGELAAYRDRQAAQRAAAHMVNGGEALFPCPSCKGSGTWRGSRGGVGKCFKCQGKGKVAKGIVTAAKVQETKATNYFMWLRENDDLIQGLRRHQWNRFLAGLLGQI